MPRGLRGKQPILVKSRQALMPNAGLWIKHFPGDPCITWHMRSRCYVCREDWFNLTHFYNSALLMTIAEKRWSRGKYIPLWNEGLFPIDLRLEWMSLDIDVASYLGATVKCFQVRYMTICIYATTNDIYISNWEALWWINTRRPALNHQDLLLYPFTRKLELFMLNLCQLKRLSSPVWKLGYRWKVAKCLPSGPLGFEAQLGLRSLGWQKCCHLYKGNL